MKVLHVIFSGLGGHGNVVFPLIENDFGKSFDNHLVFYGVDAVNEDYISKCENQQIPFTVIPKKQRKYLGSFKLFKEFLKSAQPDVIFIHNNELIIPATKYAKRTKAVSIYVEHENNQSKSKFMHFLSKYALRKADSIVCLNENMVLENQKLYGEKGKTVLINNGINTSQFENKSQTDKIIFGLAGRMVEVKDHKNLISAFAKIASEFPESELHFAGDGPLKVKLEEQTKEAGISEKVKFLGLLSEEKMVQFYNSISVYSHATHAENMSTAILQAMSCGLPIITSDIENNKLIVEDGENGWLYSTGNHQDLYEKMKAAIEKKSEFKKIGATNRNKVKELYSVDKMSLKYTELIQSLT